ncbi:NACHT domain-containing protein [Streptomyces sp. NPDC006307]|uniref:NACHT domain-containing protein n=1 Tax=Streptomyces sp. NPDC006307 TaxID=3156748 RepID=UPI0033AA86ED
MELAVVRLAGTVLGAVARSLVAPRAGAGLVDRPLRPLPRPAKPDRLARVLSERLTTSYGSLPDHERLAAVDSVRDTFAAAGEIGAERLFRLDLDPARLAGELHAPAAGLSPRALGLYEELLALCCAHLVEQLTAHPSFPARAAVEQTRAAGRTRALVEDLATAPYRRRDAEALDFEERYAAYVTETYGRLELFGLTLGRSAGEWPLDTAYISLTVSDPGGAERRDAMDLPHAGRGAVTAEQALAESDRVLLRGPAGSGKSTLVQWLALNAARRTFPAELADWNRCVPFVLRLRAFASAEALPLPDDFLRAAGVPLHGSTPGGWVEQLMASGRALVLVDGVDEVPARLRSRTAAWLKSLIAAFPEARYVVTTRPSAVPEDWLAPQGFTARSLLPMDREDIRAFVAHWHASARLESPAETELLHTYEQSLLQAVTTRRDLGRLATNPLMCALLCALNRDRRMHLPRARKELYDAALDMLLVRRDMEREIGCVEGVSLSREEQTALLQRLAYWLVRNGQAEAARAEAVEMVGEWLTAMPQVTAGPDAVFAHLLIRSGLLREPVPGSVDFVHRTFQDYLGAKAAVESRDFGVLVRHAHDDQWDDVVRMAVGHARVEERARLLRQLLKRADRAPRLRHRLVLLAAACLEHAPELDPAVRAEVETRARELVPPRSLADAQELAKVGELVLELLPGPEGLEEEEAAAVVRTAALVGGEAGLEVVARFREDGRFAVEDQVSDAWGQFDTEVYARRVLSAGRWDPVYVRVRTPEQFAALRHVPHARSVSVGGPHSDLRPLRVLEAPEYVLVNNNPVLTDLGPLAEMPSLRRLGLYRCTALTDLSPLAGTGLERLFLLEAETPLSLEPLAELENLDHLGLDFPCSARSLADVPVGPQLTELSLYARSGHLHLDGLDRWPRLHWLSLASDRQRDELLAHHPLPELDFLRLQWQNELDLRSLVPLSGLRELFLYRCGLVGGLGPLRDLPLLTSFWLSGSHTHDGPIDLRPLLGLDQLTITLTGDMPLIGEEHFAPGRIIRRR